MSEENKLTSGWNINSILITVGCALLIAAICWFGKASMDSRDMLNRTLPTMDEKINGLSRQMSTLVTRPELDNKILELRNEQLKIQNEMLKVAPEHNNKTVSP